MEDHSVPPSTNIPSSDLDAETVKKLRGDAIGDTLYSESFVVKTLMQLTDLQWDEKVEDELCFLWDMSEEPSVCEYLLQVSYPELACAAITKHGEPRFIEIVVGIFANILCSKCYNHINRQEIDVVLDLLHSDDPYILIQVMRFVHAISFIFDKLDFISEDYINRFCFILDNSTNQELLGVCLKAVSSITDDLKLDVNIVGGGLFKTAITAFTSLKTDDKSNKFESQEIQTNIKYLVQLACHLCVYVDSFNVAVLKNDLSLSLPDFFAEISDLLGFFTEEDNLFPIDKSFTFYIDALAYICRVLNVKDAPNIVVPVCKILLLVLKRKDSENFQVCAELLCYFISESVNEFRTMSWIRPVLLEIERCKFTYDFAYLTNLRMVVENFE